MRWPRWNAAAPPGSRRQPGREHRPHSGLRHVEVIARVLATKAAARLSPQQWASAEKQLAAQAELFTPAELHHWGVALVELLDQDGAEPDDRPPASVNEGRQQRATAIPTSDTLPTTRPAASRPRHGAATGW